MISYKKNISLICYYLSVKHKPANNKYYKIIYIYKSLIISNNILMLDVNIILTKVNIRIRICYFHLQLM